MKRSPSSSCSSSSSSSCVVPAASCDSPEQPEEQKKPKHKRARKCRLSSDDAPNSNAASPVSGRRSSIHRGVTRHRWTGRFEAHLWDKSSWNNIQNKKGRQVYLGAYDSEEAAARTYDLAALKYWGPGTTLNFPIEEYKKEVEEMQNVSKEEYLASLRRRSSGFSRGVSKYRGVARHHHNGRWEARIGRVLGNKYLYLGTYNTQEEAAAAYDMAAIQYRGANAVTNFDISNYIDRLKKKGVHIDLPKQQQQLEQQTTPNFTVNDKLIEIEVKQQQPKKKRKKKIAEIEETLGTKVESIAEAVPIPIPPSSQQLQYTRFSQCVDSPTIIDPVESQELDHPWSFCMDVDGSSFPNLTVSDLPFEKYSDLLDDCKGFEDNIDLIFEVGPDECVLDIVEPNAVTGQEALLMSTCSPTSSDSCNYCSV